MFRFRASSVMDFGAGGFSVMVFCMGTGRARSYWKYGGISQMTGKLEVLLENEVLDVGYSGIGVFGNWYKVEDGGGLTAVRLLIFGASGMVWESVMMLGFLLC